MSKQPLYMTPAAADRLGGPIARKLSWWRDRAGQRLANLGCPTPVLARRWVRHKPASAVGNVLEVHPERRHTAPLPFNLNNAKNLSRDPGWWGFSQRDVLNRPVSPARVLTLSNTRILSCQTPDAAMDFSPAIMDPTGQSLDLREIRYRPFHAALAARPPDLVMDHAVWIAERVFDNHSHWLSAHLPKLVLLKDRGQLTDLVLPEKRPQTVDDSLRMLSIDPEDCAVLPLNAVLYAKTLTLVENDRFDPALLNATRAALAPTRTPTRRIFISRKAAKGRKLIEEEQLMPVLTEAGFETVVMEHLNFAEQIDLMSETAVLLAPHGAGLTNMLFCPIGTRVIEMADPAYPNPNFYAMAAALGLPYALIAAKGVGAAHPLEQDLSVDPAEVARVLALI